MRNVLVLHVARKTVHGRISYHMKATGGEGEKPTRLPTTCRHSKRIFRRYRVDSPPFAVGKVRTSLCQDERCGVASR